MNKFQGFSFEEKQLIQGTIVPYEQTNQLENYYPVALSQTQQQIIWRELSDIQFTSSFFSDTLNNQAIEKRKVCYTPFSILHDLFPENKNLNHPDCIEPSGFIFHVSRCGSTLLTQMLASLDSCVVMSEPPIMDAVFRFLHAHQNFSEKEAFVRQMISALARQRSPLEKHFFIKFDSWHVAWIPLIRSLYPTTPIVFLYREPAEVLASHKKQRGPQMIPQFIDLSALQPTTDDIPIYDFDAYCLRMQLSFYESVLGSLTPLTTLTPMATLDSISTLSSKLSIEQTSITLVNYKQLPDIVCNELLHLFSMKVSEQEVQQLMARTSFHSKNQHHSFSQDLPAKTSHPEYANTFLSYEKLEKLRLSQLA